MGDLLHFKSDNTAIVELLDQGIHFSPFLLRHFNIEQGELFPVIPQSDQPNIHMVQWGIENPIIAEGPRLNYIYGPSIEKQESLKMLLRHQRIIIPVNKFIHRSSVEDSDVVIEQPQKKILWMGGIWYEGNNGNKGFALITKNSIEQHRQLIRRMPIFLNHPSVIHQWLDKNLNDITELKNLIYSCQVPTITNDSLAMVES